MQPVGCCGGFAATMVGLDVDCYVTRVDNPQKLQGDLPSRQEMVDVKSTTPLYLPDCDGWLVSYQSVANRSVKPA